MSISIVKRAEGRYAVVVSERQAARRCEECRRKVWVRDHPADDCPKCGSRLGPPASERRQTWHHGSQTRKAAREERDELAKQVRGQAYVRPARLTVAKFLEREWLPATERRVRPSTLNAYHGIISKHISPTLGDVVLQQLAPGDLNRLYSKLLIEGKSKASGLSPKTVRNVHVLIHRMLSDAVRWGHVVRNVADLADPPKASASRPAEQSVWTPDQARAFLDSIRSHRLYPAFALDATTGLRRGEVLGVRWQDLDLEAGSLTVRQAVISVAYKVMISEPKSEKGRRTISLHPSVVAILRQHKKRIAEERLALGEHYQDHGLVFPREDGAPIHPDYFSQLFDRQVARSGLPRIRLHDLKHSHAAHLIAAGVPVKVIQERLGHHSAAFTLDQYGHLMQGLDEAAAQATGEGILG